MGPRILVVDDEVDFLETLQKRFRHRKYSVNVAPGGREALDSLDRDPRDVVILDMRMPGMDGLQVLQEIRKRFPQVEVILLTGHASIEAGVQGMSLGAYDYVLKPVDFDVLLEKVAQAYQRTQLNRG